MAAGKLRLPEKVEATIPLCYKLNNPHPRKLRITVPNIKNLGGVDAMTQESKIKEQHLEKLTIKKLQEIAAELPHERAIHDMKKEELIAFIKQAKGIKDEASAHKHKHKGKIKMAKPELKAKIRELKKLRLQALETKEGAKALTLRYHIARLKKQSRRMP